MKGTNNDASRYEGIQESYRIRAEAPQEDPPQDDQEAQSGEAEVGEEVAMPFHRPKRRKAARKPRAEATTTVTLTRKVPKSQAQAVKQQAQQMGWKTKAGRTKKKRTQRQRGPSIRFL